MRSGPLGTRLALFGMLALVSAASSRPGAAAEEIVPRRKVSLVPLFDTNTRFKAAKTFKLRFRAIEQGSGAPVARNDISFALRHGPNDAAAPLPVRQVGKGIFELPFEPLGPGQYAILASIRGAASIPPVRLGVVGVAAGIIEQPPEADAEAMRHGGKSIGKR